MVRGRTPSAFGLLRPGRTPRYAVFDDPPNATLQINVIFIPLDQPILNVDFLSRMRGRLGGSGTGSRMANSAWAASGNKRAQPFEVYRFLGRET